MTSNGTNQKYVPPIFVRASFASLLTVLHACIVVNIVWADDADDHADVYHDDGLLQGVDAAWK